MCGIAALIRYPNGNIAPDMIRQMTNAIRHRGPDDEGYLLYSKDLNKVIAFGGQDTPVECYESRLPYSPANISKISEISSHQISVLLGHRRLSIVDLSPTGHQPMRPVKGQIWITYNGEIYNYIELRKELEKAGYTFCSQSDTEVILNAYHHWGTACLHKFNGMFAFVIVDLEQNTLFIARDRFGVKPLYLWESPEGFLAIASEIKQFTFLPGWRSKANLSRSVDYLLNGLTDFSNQTLFENVVQLKGGECIECPLDLVKFPSITTWYRLKRTPFKLTFYEGMIRFQALLADSISLRLRADVDVGSCLSGGLDSSSIVCITKRLLNLSNSPAKQKTFSACSHIPRFDERHYMDEVIVHTGVDAHFVTPSLDQLFPMIKEMIWHQDEPFGSTSIFAQYLVFQLAKKANVKVMLDGQGSDENLAGYNSFWPAHLAQLLKNFRWLSFLKEAKILREINPTFELSHSSLLKHMLPFTIKNGLKQLLRKQSWINLPYSDYSIGEAALSFPDNVNHLVDQLSYEQLTRTSLPALLRYEDRNSMAHSIEARTPFLDYRLVEFTFNLPAYHKISEGFTKKVMRAGLNRVLPEKVLTRTDKLGFATAEEVWMCDEKPDLFRREIVQAVEKSQGLISEKAVEMADKMLNKHIPFNWALWRIINFGYWIDTFNVKI